MKLGDRVVMVTGSSSGIGSETAELFSEKGSNVVVTYNRGEEEGKETLKECKKKQRGHAYTARRDR